MVSVEWGCAETQLLALFASTKKVVTEEVAKLETAPTPGTVDAMTVFGMIKTMLRVPPEQHIEMKWILPEPERCKDYHVG